MDNIKKIALIICASNFERQKNIVKYVHQRIKELGGYALYVITSYGLFREDTPYEKGEASIYSLLEKDFFDGCIIEGNLGNSDLIASISGQLTKKQVPFVILNYGEENNIPFVMSDAYDAGCQLMEHLINVHNCRKINITITPGEDIFSIQSLRAYKDILDKYNIPYEEKRVISKTVSIPNGREMFHIFRERGIDDAQAFLCVHDVYAIGMCIEMEEQGYNVPEDLLICSLNRSVNSMVFEPCITGADRRDDELSASVVDLLVQKMEGKELPLKTYVKSKIYYGESCGCQRMSDEHSRKHRQQLVLGKIEAGNQISQMMKYNDSLEGIVSVEELGDNIKNMMRGINCSEYIFCLNERAIKYITSDVEYKDLETGNIFDATMVAVSGMTKSTGELKDYTFPFEKLLPVDGEEGDIFILLPIHHNEQVYGYIAFVNDYLPIEIYNYRICHESIGSSMKNLHRQMILRKSIQELDELHMRDALTGLYNRFALERFCSKYFKNRYTVVMIDMDGLKAVNDGYGHLAGNNAICITADVIRNSVDKDDLVIRYGGDEFLVLSLNVDIQHWEGIEQLINERMVSYVAHQKLPYKLGASLGYAICNEECLMTFDECCEMADKAMYESKKNRKSDIR